MFEKKTAENELDDIKIDAEEGEFIRDNLIPYSIEYYLKLVKSLCYSHGDCDSHDD
jgi:hypothetical protein